jgi:hypothetical protein
MECNALATHTHSMSLARYAACKPLIPTPSVNFFLKRAAHPTARFWAMQYSAIRQSLN